MSDTISTTPTYNLKVVVAETGIKPDTLRAWERRYGLPQPQRTAGKHRLYSQYDLETIKWLIARQAEGMSISRAVKLFQQLKDEGQDPLYSYGGQVLESQPTAAISGTQIEELRQVWLDACSEFNEKAAEQVLAQAFAIYPPEIVCLQLLMEGISIIGNRWYAGEATVQQEHFASSLAMRRLHTLVSAAPPPTRRERIIVGCPPQEDHAFVSLLITLLLRYRGWDVIYLGADVPRERLEATLDTIHPSLVLLSAQQLHTAAQLKHFAEFLNDQDVAVAFGGLIFNLLPELPERIPGHFLGKLIKDVPHKVENIISYHPPIPDILPMDRSYPAALSQFHRKQSQIEAHVWQNFHGTEMPYEQFVNVNMHMARNIIAALTLGNMDYIGHELAWIKQLLANYQWPVEILYRYILSYHEASALYLNGQGLPITDWLATVIENGNESAGE
ncbi:MAG: MerR family transcriptional regulator [Candidatus Promineifilaceae bacterium]|nr:MerR family transcriptional regulator [Candidatus Promineifilaceae bacterium]